MEALDALGYEYLVEPERPAWSLRWSRVKPDPCPFSVSVLGLRNAALGWVFYVTKLF